MPKRTLFRTRTTGTIRQRGKVFPVRPESSQSARLKLPTLSKPVPSDSQLLIGRKGIVFDTIHDGDTAASIYDRLSAKFPERISFKSILSDVRWLHRKRYIEYVGQEGKVPTIKFTERGKRLKKTRRLILPKALGF